MPELNCARSIRGVQINTSRRRPLNQLQLWPSASQLQEAGRWRRGGGLLGAAGGCWWKHQQPAKICRDKNKRKENKKKKKKRHPVAEYDGEIGFIFQINMDSPPRLLPPLLTPEIGILSLLFFFPQVRRSEHADDTVEQRGDAFTGTHTL